MKIYLLFLVFLVLTLDSYCQNLPEPIKSVELHVNGNLKKMISQEDEPVVVVHESNRLTIRVTTIPNVKCKLVKVGESDLPPIIKYQDAIGIKSVNKPKDVIHKFPILGLKGDKIYYFVLKYVVENSKGNSTDKDSSTVEKKESDESDKDNVDIETHPKDSKEPPVDTTTEFGFYLEVHSTTHLEAAIGPTFTLLDMPVYSLVPSLTHSDSVTIKNTGTNESVLFVIAAIYRPWGYNQREKFGIWKNRFIFFGLGLNDKQKIYENIFLGVGTGGKGINAAVGVHLSWQPEFLTGYALEGIYPKDKIKDIASITIKRFRSDFFGSISIDAAAFLKIFSSAIGLK